MYTYDSGLLKCKNSEEDNLCNTILLVVACVKPEIQSLFLKFFFSSISILNVVFIVFLTTVTLLIYVVLTEDDDGTSSLTATNPPRELCIYIIWSGCEKKSSGGINRERNDGGAI